jgi:hypothetical protein
VYFTNNGDAYMSNGSVIKVPLAVGSLTRLASGMEAQTGIAVDAAYVYWATYTDPGAVMAMPVAGGALMTLASGQYSPYAIAIDATTVYWTNNTNTGGTVMKVAKP